MAGRTTDRAAALEAIYAEVPTVDCQGLCAGACGPIRMTGIEHRRVADAGVDIPPGTLNGPHRCPALTVLNRCAVYAARPLICRLWGVTEGLPCPWGCRPEPRPLTDAEAARLIRRAEALDQGRCG